MGNQLIATSHTGRIGVWNAVTKHWQVRVLAVPFPGVQTVQTREGFLYAHPTWREPASPAGGQSPGACVKGLRSISEAFLEEGLPCSQERGEFGKERGFSRHWVGKQVRGDGVGVQKFPCM